MIITSILDILAGLGSALDTYSGASSVRDLIAGENPFDQFIDPFNEDKRTTGRVMLEKRGVVGENEDQGWVPDVGDLLGFAAETVLDPTNLIGGGLLKRILGSASKAKAANKGIEAANALSKQQRAMGFMPEEVAKVTKIREPEKWRVVPGKESEVRQLFREAYTEGGTPAIEDPFIHEIVIKGDPQELIDVSMSTLGPRLDIDDVFNDPYITDAVQNGLVEWRQGGPQRLFHGTHEVFDRFDRNPSGTFLSPDAAYANSYASPQSLRRRFLEEGQPLPEGRPHVRMAYVDSRNPMRADHAPFSHIDSPLTLHEHGYDAAISTDGQEIVVFDPSQIYLPYIAKELQELQRVASPNSLLAKLAAYNTLARGRDHFNDFEDEDY